VRTDTPYIVAGFVSWRLREENVLAPALILVECDGEIADLSDQLLLRNLETEHADLLARHGIEHLDAEHVLATHRDITQAISGSLYRDGAAGIRYYSHLDMEPCFVLFEGRAALESAGNPEPLTDDIPELLQVSSDYRLVLQRVDISLVDISEAEVQLGALRLRHSQWRGEIQAVHQQILELTQRIHQEGNLAVALLQTISDDFERIAGMPEGTDQTQHSEAMNAQLGDTLRRATDAIRIVGHASESISQFQHMRDRLGEDATRLERLLLRFRATIENNRLPSDIGAEARFLLDDLRSWTPDEHADS
jgi:hypothetical protein